MLNAQCIVRRSCVQSRGTIRLHAHVSSVYGGREGSKRANHEIHYDFLPGDIASELHPSCILLDLESKIVEYSLKLGHVIGIGDNLGSKEEIDVLRCARLRPAVWRQQCRRCPRLRKVTLLEEQA